MSLWDIESRSWGTLVQPLSLRAKRALCREAAELSRGCLGSPADRMALEVQCKQIMSASADLSASDVLSVLGTCYAAVRDSESVPAGAIRKQRANPVLARVIAGQQAAVRAAGGMGGAAR
jgi:hypothetical protein